MRILLSLVVAGLMVMPAVAQDPSPSQGSDRLSPSASSERSEAERADARESMTVPADTRVVVRTDEVIDSTTANERQSFAGSVQEAVTGSDGQILIPRGSRARLVVRNVSSGSAASAQLALGLESIEIRGRRYAVDSSDIAQSNNRGIGKNRRTGEYVGGGAVLGTLLGAIAGGGKGAAIGAVAGAAAGGTAQVLTKGKEVKVPAETTLTFRLDEPLTLRASGH